VDYWPDGDGDGFGDSVQPAWSGCGPAPAGWAADVGDCDDTDDTVHPGARDVPYDGVDADCDGSNDYDADGDGYPAAPWSTGESDCDDTNPAAYPGATEVPLNGADENCNGSDVD
jgi:hypothetical protein